MRSLSWPVSELHTAHTSTDWFSVATVCELRVVFVWRNVDPFVWFDSLYNVVHYVDQTRSGPVLNQSGSSAMRVTYRVKALPAERLILRRLRPALFCVLDAARL